MRINDEELAKTVASVMEAIERRAERGGMLYPEEWPVDDLPAEAAILDLQEARSAIKAYVDWCDNKAGPNVIPYEVLDNLRKCVENDVDAENK